MNLVATLFLSPCCGEIVGEMGVINGVQRSKTTVAVGKYGAGRTRSKYLP
jgi:hypothetical protein